MIGDAHLEEALLQELAAGAIDEPRLASLRRHLARCRPCRRKTAAQLRALEAPVEVEGFTSLELLGAGPTGRVYRARHQSGEVVALKVLWAFNSLVGSTDRMLAKVRAANALRHSGLANVLGIGASTTNRPCVASELLVGRNFDVVVRNERLSRSELLDLLVELLHPVAALHREGLAHGHLSGTNVLVLDGPGPRQVRLLDAALTFDEAATAEDDLYAVGAFAFELLTGKAPGNAPTLPPLEPAGVSTLLLQLLDSHGPSRPSADETLATLRRLGAGSDHPMVASGPARELPMPAAKPPAPPPPDPLTVVDGEPGALAAPAEVAAEPGGPAPLAVPLPVDQP